MAQNRGRGMMRKLNNQKRRGEFQKVVPPGNSNSSPELDLRNKITVSQLADLSKLSKPFISQVKAGKRPPSKKLLQALASYHASITQVRKQTDGSRAIRRFIESRREGTSAGTIEFHEKYLSKAIPVLGLNPSPMKLARYIEALSCSVGGKHAYYRAISVFYNWLYSPKSAYGFQPADNPVLLVEAPKPPKMIMPSLTRNDVDLLLSKATNNRDRAIIALFTDSGLRLSELARLKQEDFDWGKRTVKVVGKGNKEGFAPFGGLSEMHLKAWFDEYKPTNGEPIWKHWLLGYQGHVGETGS